jgi:hypothetical protein
VAARPFARYRGVVTIDVAGVHPLEEAATALKDAAAGRTPGGVVISLAT